MTEKQLIRVENWGETTLKRMQQLFFHSKYCDLTLRFNNNTALKVHRLVLRMYTDYFDRLEAHYKSDGSVMMPRNLQADVALPLIKFFYTGTIELDDYRLPSLLEAAKLIRVPVLVEFLGLHQKLIRNRVTAVTTLAQKKPTNHPLLANRDVTVNILDKKHKTTPQVIHKPVVKMSKICKSTKNMRNKNDGLRILSHSPISVLINSAMLKGEAIAGPSRYQPQTKNSRPGSPFGQISYDNMVDNVNERVSRDGI